MSLFLLADLDCTIIPNGPQPESPEARPTFRHLTARSDVTLIYVTGRHASLIEEAIIEYDLPTPDYAIGGVGTTIYKVGSGPWEAWESWTDEIRPDWQVASDPYL